MTKHLIVGVDPGTTCAVAALGLDGSLAGVKSSRDMGAPQVIEYILSLGGPSLIASDVNPPPAFVSTIASRFGVRLYVPEKTMQVADKLELSRPYDLSDAHQRDALAAALNAYRAYKHTFRRIDSLGLPEEVKHMVLQGVSVSAAKASLEKPPEAPESVDEPRMEREPSVVERRIRELERRIRTLNDTVLERERETEALRQELAKARRVVHTKPEPKPAYERQIKSLAKRVHELKQEEGLLRRAVSGEILLVGVWPQACNGMSLVEVKPESAEGLAVAFTSSGRVREFLKASGVEVHDAGQLQRQASFHYLPAKRLGQLRKEAARPDLERIIRDYKSARR